MKPRTILRVMLVFLFAAVGLWLLMLRGSQEIGILYKETTTPSEIYFQQVFWEQRPLDIMLQACLIISGALGVAALLPAKDEE